MLGVAFQYTYNGRVYQVGEFSQDVPPDTTGNAQRVLFFKIIESYFTANTVAYLGFDDEERVLRWFWSTGATGF